MIIDKLEQIDRYPQLAEIKDAVREFLHRVETEDLANGRYELMGDNLFVLLQSYPTKEKKDARMEAHKKYADLQYVISGEEVIYYDVAAERKESAPYNPEKDIVFFETVPDKGGILLTAGMFGWYEPQDAHMPCVTGNEVSSVRKAVFKVRL